MAGRGAVQSLERAFALLEALSMKPEGVQLTELSQVTGLHKSTVHRLLASLAALGYVRRPEDGGKYRMSLKLVEMAGRLTENIDVLGIAKPYLEKLRDICEETVHLAVGDGGDIVYIHKLESSRSVYRTFSRVGMRRPMYCTASGKCLLADLTDGEVREIWQHSDIAAHTPNTITSVDALLAELERVRGDGYAMDDEENEAGVRCIAAGVPDFTGRCRAAFSVSAPVLRMDDRKAAQTTARILDMRRLIAAELGYHGKL